MPSFGRAAVAMFHCDSGGDGQGVSTSPFILDASRTHLGVDVDHSGDRGWRRCDCGVGCGRLTLHDG